MAFEVTDVANVESPSCLPGKLVVGKIEFLDGRVEGEDDVLLESLCGGVIDQVMGKIEVEDSCCHFQQLNQQLRT